MVTISPFYVSSGFYYLGSNVTHNRKQNSTFNYNVMGKSKKQMRNSKRKVTQTMTIKKLLFWCYRF